MKIENKKNKLKNKFLLFQGKPEILDKSFYLTSFDHNIVVCYDKEL